MVYKLSDEEFNEVRRLLEKAENILRKEDFLLAKIINQAHFNIADIRQIQKKGDE